MLLKETALLRLAGLRIPMFLFLGPRVVELDDDRCAIEIPLTWRSKNHFIGGMYFGALCAGADLAGGLPAAKLIAKHPGLKLVFGQMRAEFLKRADGDVVFRSKDARRVADLAREAVRTGERVASPVEVVATVPSKYGDEPVARFEMTISLKVKAAERSASERTQGEAHPPPAAAARAARGGEAARGDAS